MNYKENDKDSAIYKEEYLHGLNDLIRRREKDAASIRASLAAEILREPELYRRRLREMLGFPLCEAHPQIPPYAEKTLLSEEDGYTVFRLRIEVLDGLFMTGLYFRLNCKEKCPLSIVQHGGEGTPELVAGIYGYTNNYHDMLMRVLKQGVHVFAPQLLLWKTEKYGVPYQRDMIDAKLKRVGSSMTAVEVFGIMRVIDYLQTLPEVASFGMVGLSYGGFYTQMTAALDTRIRSAVSCSYFNERDRHAFVDWTWRDSAYLFDDAELALLVYPRKLCLAVGERDELFDCEGAKAAFAVLQEYCKEIGTDWLAFFTFDGMHEFFFDDDTLRKFAEELKA